MERHKIVLERLAMHFLCTNYNIMTRRGVFFGLIDFFFCVLSSCVLIRLLPQISKQMRMNWRAYQVHLQDLWPSPQVWQWFSCRASVQLIPRRPSGSAVRQTETKLTVLYTFFRPYFQLAKHLSWADITCAAMTLAALSAAIPCSCSLRNSSARRLASVRAFRAFSSAFLTCIVIFYSEFDPCYTNISNSRVFFFANEPSF